MKKFYSDIEALCGFTVAGTTSLSTATGITVATSDNSTKLATTAFVKAQGYLTAEVDTLDTVTDRNSITTNSIGVGAVNIIGTTAGAELLTVDGTFGRLFTVTDDLSDSLFSVNTIAGLPVIEVFADNTINLGAFSNPITIDGSSNIVIPGTITASGYNNTNWNTAYNDRIVSAAVSGTTTKTLTLTQTDGGTISTSWTDINTDTDGYISNVSLVGSTLSFTSVGSAFSGIIDLSTLTPTVRTVFETVKNVSGATILKGTPLAVVAGQTSGNVSDVIPADAADPAKMPAIFIANQNIADEAEGEAVLFGNLTGVNTSAYTSGTTVYVAPGGGWTATKPVHPNLIQNLGVITKQHATNGAGIVTGVGRANSLPNLTAGKIWVGSATYPIESTTVHVDEANGRVGIGTTSPAQKLHVVGNTTITGVTYTDIVQTYSGASIDFRHQDASVVMRVDTANARVGIGTTSPTDKLQVVASTYNGITITTPDVATFKMRSSGGGTTNWGFATTNLAASDFGIYESNSTGGDPINAGTARLYFKTGGNVGIGTTNPSYKLQVNAAGEGLYVIGANTAPYTQTIASFVYGGNGNSINIENQGGKASIQARAGASSMDLLLNADGSNVGIGTISPTTKLHVVGTVTATAIQLNTGSGDYYINGSSNILRIGSLSTANKIQLELFHATNPVSLGIAYNGGQALPYIESVHPSYDVNTHLLFKPGGGETWRIGSHGSNHVYASAFAIKPASNNYDFYLANSSGTALFYSDTSTGNIGIGTASPDVKLSVAPSTDVSAKIGYAFIGKGTDAGLSGWAAFGNINMQAANQIALTQDGNGLTVLNAASGQNIRFRIANADKAIIDSSGNVGIGTTSPAFKLDINGASNSSPFRVLSTNTTSLRTFFEATSGNVEQHFLYTGNQDWVLGLDKADSNKFKLASADDGFASAKLTVTTSGNVGIGIATPTNKLQVANGNMSITTGYSFILADTDTNWRLGRNIIVESGNYLTASTFQLVAANAVNEGWQFVNDDGFTVLEIGAETSARNVWINAGNLSVGVASPQEKIHVAGNIRIDGGSTAAILQTNNATAAEAGTTYRTFTTADHYAVFVDYVVYDAGRSNMRTGTFRAVWTTGDVVYTDVSTVDLGATDNVTLTAAISGANVNLIVTGPADYTLKYSLKVIK
jgi:hypothetical protein